MAFATLDQKKNRFRLCVAITSIAIVFTIAATAANQFLQGLLTLVKFFISFLRLSVQSKHGINHHLLNTQE